MGFILTTRARVLRRGGNNGYGKEKTCKWGGKNTTRQDWGLSGRRGETQPGVDGINHLMPLSLSKRAILGASRARGFSSHSYFSTTLTPQTGDGLYGTLQSNRGIKTWGVPADFVQSVKIGVAPPPPLLPHPLLAQYSHLQTTDAVQQGVDGLSGGLLEGTSAKWSGTDL